MGCNQTQHLYHFLNQHHHPSVLFALLEPFCARPPAHLGFGLPVLDQSSRNVSFMTDIDAFTDLHHWSKLIILHQPHFDVNTFDQMVRAVNKRHDIEMVEYQFDEDHHGHNLELLRTIKQDSRSPQFVIVFGHKSLIEDMIISLRELSMLNFKFKWMFVLAESVPIDSFQAGVKDIISTSDISLVNNQVGQHCQQYHHQCLPRLIFEAIHQAYSAFEPEIESTNSTRLPIWIKNRFLSYLKVYVRKFWF